MKKILVKKYFYKNLIKKKNQDYMPFQFKSNQETKLKNFLKIKILKQRYGIGH